MENDRPLRILILALGGEGGGVLMNWVVAAGRRAGYAVQASSVPGVAQRTGATSYYIEVAKANDARAAALALVPMPGRVDVVIASELMETARAMERGFVSPDLTTLITSSNRVYATAEKMAMTDGRYDSDAVADTAQALAKSLHMIDLSALAQDHDTFISATMFGALAGSGALPWSTDDCRRVMGEGRGAEANKSGFDAASKAVVSGDASPTANVTPSTSPALLLPSDLNLSAVSEELASIAAHGHDLTVDFQDAEYGRLYLLRLQRLMAAADTNDHTARHALTEAARRLAAETERRPLGASSRRRAHRVPRPRRASASHREPFGGLVSRRWHRTPRTDLSAPWSLRETYGRPQCAAVMYTKGNRIGTYVVEKERENSRKLQFARRLRSGNCSELVCALSASR